MEIKICLVEMLSVCLSIFPSISKNMLFGVWLLKLKETFEIFEVLDCKLLQMATFRIVNQIKSDSTLNVFIFQFV